MSEDLATLLRSSGHKVTEPRRIVWDVLQQADSHLTAEEITSSAQLTAAGINRASVYRSLTLFADLGVARESILGPDDSSRWEVAHPDEHFHLICSHCGNVDHHVGDLVEQIRTHLGGDHNFTAQHVELSVTGLCHDCAHETGATH